MTQERWGAVSVAANQELRVASSAERYLQHGIRVYVPAVTTRVWVGRLRRWVPRTRPLLRGYALVGLDRPAVGDEELSRIVPGVNLRLVRDSSGYAARVSPGEVEVLRDVESRPEEHGGGDLTLQFRAGRVFVVQQGVLAGMPALCLRDARPGDARGLFTVGERRVKIQLAFLARAG